MQFVSFVTNLCPTPSAPILPAAILACICNLSKVSHLHVMLQ
ncbi:hypothetical protein HMPREF0880_01557 [Yokenella regensburgei ATCC 43003]|nr:hypothetical protein HMPREF0880_01557 [Yokenella regensburgei ATCC 43003]